LERASLRSCGDRKRPVEKLPGDSRNFEGPEKLRFDRLRSGNPYPFERSPRMRNPAPGPLNPVLEAPGPEKLHFDKFR